MVNGTRASDSIAGGVSSSAAVVIIGGGVIGASIAYHLALNGVRDVIVLDRAAAPGAGSTGKATGGYRAQFATAINVRLSLLARAKLIGFREETGVDPGYQPVGYLWLAADNRQLELLRESQRMQHAEGLSEAVELSLDDIADVNPAISLDRVAGAAFCSTDGYIRPLEILRGYIEAAARLGVRFVWNEEVISAALTQSGCLKQISTAKATYSADHYVNAAGAWAATVASFAEVALPVVPLRRQAALSVPTNVLPASMPMTIFMEDNFHMRIRDGRVLLCWPTPEPAGTPSSLRADQLWIDEVTAKGHERAPVLRNVEIDRAMCYAGLYEMSPDDHAIIGRSVECENLWLANGSSGHGVMHSPAIGHILSDLIFGRTPPVDVTQLRPSRFAEGAAIVSSELI